MKRIYKFCALCASPLRKKRERLVCVRCPFVNYQNPRPTVSCFILKGKKILLVRRGNKPYLSWWDLPGGFIEKRETPEIALKREMAEEIGINIRISKFFGIYPGIYPSSFEPFAVLGIFYVTKPLGTEHVLDKNEIREAQWFSKQELPQKVAFDSNQRALRDFIKTWN